jgi:hypothetical protein
MAKFSKDILRLRASHLGSLFVVLSRDYLEKRLCSRDPVRSSQVYEDNRRCSFFLPRREFEN